MAMILPSEFDSHVFKRHGTNGRPVSFVSANGRRSLLAEFYPQVSPY